MTKAEIGKDFFSKTVLPVCIIIFLFLIFRNVFTSDGETDYFFVWLVCGIPFGIRRMSIWLIPHSQASLQFAIGIWALNFIIGGIIGGFVLIWKLICAGCYLILTIYRIFTYNGNSNRITRNIEY